MVKQECWDFLSAEEKLREGKKNEKQINDMNYELLEIFGKYERY